jgi:hypothetical protein
LSRGRPLTGAAVIPPALLESMRVHLEQNRVDAILASDEPLSADDQKALEEGLNRAREQYEAARERVRAITARLARPPTRPTSRAR